MTLGKLFICAACVVFAPVLSIAEEGEADEEIAVIPVLSADLPCYLKINGGQISKQNMKAYIMPPQGDEPEPICILAGKMDSESGIKAYGEIDLKDAASVSTKLKLAAKVIEIANQKNSLVDVKIASFGMKTKMGDGSLFRDFDLEIFVQPNPLTNANSVVLRRLFFRNGDEKKDVENVYMDQETALILAESLNKAQAAQNGILETIKEIKKAIIQATHDTP